MPYSDKESFKKSVMLTGARVLGIVFSIAIPMYLGRNLPIETYGTYKQIMLFFWFSQVALSLGMDDSTFFYFRRDPEKLALFSFNALCFNLLLTGILWFLLFLFKEKVSSVLGNPELANYLPILGFLILVTISSMQIEGLLIVGLDNFNGRLWVEIGTEVLKSIAIFSGFFFFNSVYITLVLLSALMVIRLIGTVIIIDKCKKSMNLTFWDSRVHFVQQFKYGIPLGVSRVFQNLLNMENFYISHFFSMNQFTIYSVGCFENPLINAARSSLFEMCNIEMTLSMKDKDYQKSQEVWKSMTRKLFLIIIPFVVYMIFFAKEIITFIFSSKYLNSVPFFMIFNIFLIVGALNPEPIFRATSKTNLALRIKITGVIIGISLIVAGAHLGGALWALIGKIIGTFIMNIYGVIIGARLLKTSIFHLFYWRDLLLIVLLSVALSLLVRVLFLNSVNDSTWSIFLVLAMSFSFYFVFHFLASCFLGLIKEDEIYFLKNIFFKIISRSRLILGIN